MAGLEQGLAGPDFARSTLSTPLDAVAASVDIFQWSFGTIP